MTRLLKKRPDLRNAALLLAGAYGSLDRFDDAAVVLQEQARLTPQDPQPEIALGLTQRQAKKNDEARRAFEKAAQLAPDNLFPVDQLVDPPETDYPARAGQLFQMPGALRHFFLPDAGSGRALSRVVDPAA